MAINSYKDLVAWQKGIELVTFTYKLLQQFPDKEKYGLMSQISRAATSVPANIAEGWGRDSDANFIHYLKISKGSLFELETHLIISNNLTFINETELSEAQEKINELGKIIQGLIKSIQQPKR